MQFTSIEDCLEWLRTSGSYSDAVSDVCAAYRESKEELEYLLDSNLFVGHEQQVFEKDSDRQYRDELERIEEILVNSGLIYND